MDNWDDLKLILALSRYGTMSSAARALGLSTATVSRRLERSTEEVGQTLFVRRGQVWKPTPAAKTYIALAEALADGFPHGKSHAVSDEMADRTVRVSIPLEVCQDTLAPRIPQFLQENPKLSLDLYHEEKSVAFGEIDLRVSYEEPSEGRLIRLRLGAVGYRAYIGKTASSTPEGWVELLGFDRKSVPIIQLVEAQFGAPRMKTSSIDCAAGIVQFLPLVVYLPIRFAERQPGLRSWEPNTPPKYFAVWASYHESRRLDPDVRIALSFMKKCFEGEKENDPTLLQH